MRILYLVPLLPSRSGSGGRRAAYNHLMQQRGPNTELRLLVVDVEGKGESLSEEIRRLDPTVFPRAIPRLGSGVRAALRALGAVLTSSLPRSVRVVSSSAARRFVASELLQRHYDAVVLDHLNAYGIVRGIEIRCPLIYIAHNIEADLLREAIATRRPWTPLWFAAHLEYRRMFSLEQELLRKADRTVFIAAADLSSIPDPSVARKSRIWAELPLPKSERWRYTGSRKIVFVGSSAYVPNREAILWLRDELMPKLALLDSTITLRVIGTAEGDLGPRAPSVNVSMEGFVSDERLIELQLTADLFISPVVLGSGIKIKVLEAASYGLPILATDASLAGIDFLTGTARVLTRNAERDAETVKRLLDIPQTLEQISNATLDALQVAYKQRPPLEEQFR